jgi:uncharacterized protein YceK
MMRKFQTGAVLTLSLLLGACSSIRGLTMPEEDNLLSGAGSMMVGADGKAATFERLNIDDLMKDYGFKD